MKDRIYLIKIQAGRETGQYRILATTPEIAGDRAMSCFRREFGKEGKATINEITHHERTNKPTHKT